MPPLAMRVAAALASVVLLAAGLPGGTALAQGGIETRRVSIPAGGESTRLEGQLKGDQTVDYKVRAGAGQRLTVELQPTNPQNSMNVMAAGSDAALFIGSSSGNRFSGLLPSDGDVTVRVYLMRPAARRNETGRYALRVAVAGKALAPLPASRDALIPGTPFHAAAEVPCVIGAGAAGRCKASVIRRLEEGATVVVTNPSGQKRQFLFVKGRAVAADQPEKLTVRRRGDGSVLNLGENFERYEIPDALVVGG